MSEDGFSIAGAKEEVNKFEAELEKSITNPRKNRILPIDREYTPAELRQMLQVMGSSLAILDSIEGRLEAECHLLKEGIKTGISVMVANNPPRTGTVSGDEAAILASNENLISLKRMQLYNEAYLLALKGWRKGYEDAYAAVSRIVSLEIGEANLTSSRYP